MFEILKACCFCFWGFFSLVLMPKQQGRDKLKERLLNRKEPEIVEFENPQALQMAKDVKI